MQSFHQWKKINKRLVECWEGQLKNEEQEHDPELARNMFNKGQKALQQLHQVFVYHAEKNAGWKHPRANLTIKEVWIQMMKALQDGAFNIGLDHDGSMINAYAKEKHDPKHTGGWKLSP